MPDLNDPDEFYDPVSVAELLSSVEDFVFENNAEKALKESLLEDRQVAAMTQTGLDYLSKNPERYIFPGSYALADYGWNDQAMKLRRQMVEYNGHDQDDPPSEFAMCRAFARVAEQIGTVGMNVTRDALTGSQSIEPVRKDWRTEPVNAFLRSIPARQPGA